MARTRKNKNRRNTKKLDVCVVSTKFAFLFICCIFCLGGGLIIRHQNVNIENKIKEAETEQIELASILKTQQVNLETKLNIVEIQKQLQSHAISMACARKSQCKIALLDNNKTPTTKNHSVVAYNIN